MQIVMEQRLSESPYVERIWRSRSDDISTFVSAAVVQWELVVWTHDGQTRAAIQGPAAHASRAPVPQHSEFLGVVFRPEVFMPHLPGHRLVNRSVELPSAANQSFGFQGHSWQLPTFDNAEWFVKRLAQNGIIDRDPIVASALGGHVPEISLRSVQRRFLYITGQSHRTIRQIERARRAALLLRDGVSILDTVFDLGYTDQAHLTKSLHTFIGQTPTQLTDVRRREQLSLLYKTDCIADPTMVMTT
ncbi:MAG: helix-turn-helix transcriptional regulator [Chloroflexi bacterium]|nr:helix-turn-helix transcriptional regulator [Chloroflexota bacterium]